MTILVVMVEEPSAEIVVREICSKIEPTRARFHVIPHQGIGDLKSSFPRKIRAFDKATNFIVLRDNDGGNCTKNKTEFSRLIPAEDLGRCKIRIVCQELESWYLAQPHAIRAAGLLGRPISKNRQKMNPDEIGDAKRIFIEHANRRGQIDIAKRIAPHLDLNCTKSRSFSEFIKSVRDILVI